MSVSTKNKKPSKPVKASKASKTSNPNYKNDHIVPKPIDPKVDKICRELQQIQRRRVIVIKSRIMIVNRLRSVVAGTLGYTTKLDEAERQSKFKAAMKTIKG